MVMHAESAFLSLVPCAKKLARQDNFCPYMNTQSVALSNTIIAEARIERCSIPQREKPTVRRRAAVNSSDGNHLDVLAMPGPGCQAAMFPAR